MKIYGKTFLTKYRWMTTDLEKVDKSFWMWGESDQHSWLDDADTVWYGLSWLGVINGILYHFGDFRRLTATVDTDKDNEILGWELRDFRND